MEKGFELTQAVAEAARCLLCHDAPCSKACPAKTDPGSFIRKFRMKNITGAVRTIKENNILGGACGVLCPTARLCEKECSACGIDRPIQIGKLQRFLVENSWQTGLKVFSAKFRTKPKARKQKVAVIGGGPAGISCAAELAKAGYPVTIFEARAKIGGVLRYGVPSFRFEDDFLDRDLDDLKSLGVTIKCSQPIHGKAAVEKLTKVFDAVFIACGLWKAIELQGQKKISGLFPSTDFLSLLREKKFKDVEKFISGKDVGVIGGGSVAMDCARAAQKLGAADVYLVYRRSYAQMPAEDDEKLETLQDGIHFVLLNQPLEYLHKKGKLEGINLLRTRLGKKDKSGRRQPENVKGSEWTLPVEAVIEAIGNQPEDEIASLAPLLKLNKGNTIEINKETCKTSKPKIFAGGDIARGAGLVVDAIRDGKLAANSIIKSFGRGGKS